MTQAITLTKVKQKYELQSNNTSIIMTNSMREIDECWQKSNNCILYQFNADGSKFLVNSKKTRLRNSLEMAGKRATKPIKKGKKKIQSKITEKGKRVIRSKSNEQ